MIISAERQAVKHKEGMAGVLDRRAESQTQIYNLGLAI